MQFLLLPLDSYTVHLSFFSTSSLHLCSVMPSSSFPSSLYQMLFKIYKANIYVISKFQTLLAYHCHDSNCISRTTTFSKSELILPYEIPCFGLNSVSKNLEQYL